MTKTTLNVLATKIENMHSDVREIKTDVKTNTEFRLQTKNLQEEVKCNSDFRVQAKGIIGFVTLIATLLGGGMMWIGQKIFGGLGK